MASVTVTLAPRSIVLTIALLLLLLAIRTFTLPISLFLIAAILAAALEPLVARLEARRVPRGLAVGVVLLAMAGVFLLLMVLVVPVVIEQGTALAQQLPRYGRMLNLAFARLQALHLPAPALAGEAGLLERAVSWFAERASSWLSAGLSWTLHLVELGVALVSVGIATLFMLFSGPELRSGFVRLFPARWRPLVESQFAPAGERIGAYVRAQLLSMTALSVLLLIGLSIVRLPYAWLIAIVSGALEIVPWLGSLTGVTLATLLALTVGWPLVPLVWLVYAVSNFVQAHLLGPFIFAQAVQLPPLLVVFALLMGAQELGLLGAILAVPMLAVVLVLVDNLWIPAMDRATAITPSAPPHGEAPRA